MNRDQAAFLISLVLPFAILVSLSNYLKAKLAAAGYDVSHLILLGLPRKDSPNEYYGMDFSADLGALVSTPAFIFSAGLVLAGLLWVTVINKSAGGRKVLDPTTWLEFPLAKKTIISPNTAIYRFSLANPNDYLGLPVGKHISVGAEINGKEIVRSYTPISSDDQKGSFDLLIKSYEKGNISRHFSLLKVGDNIRVKGPKGQFDYVAGLTGGLGMIAGGSGITPMYQIIHAVLKNPADTTTLSLIYANVNPEDILMKEELDALAAAHSDRFKVYYVLNNPPAEWTGGVGFVTKEQIETRLPASTHDAKILMCGPPPMLTAMKKHLDELQWPAPRVVSKLADKVFLF
ncbi:ferredoxin reductase-like C-terminal NADP-linked domain-containing protein [Mycena alexandri]|uniref:NADH-cytochrome b5 reductase n=1 Tax=Mycena alexandri TaxID=1745969 RepID=A0AAD6XBQ3_9AGAR|nr:ferredoxin reductase-like C-terminal NADP-linked domain-containing protein [Mycena alexandri]